MSSSDHVVNLPGGVTGRRSASCVSADDKIFTVQTYIGEVQLGKIQHFLPLRLRFHTFSGLNLQICYDLSAVISPGEVSLRHNTGEERSRDKAGGKQKISTAR